MILRNLVKSAMIFSAVIYIAGCVVAPAPAKKPITELFSDGSSIKFDFKPSHEASPLTGYTIGIVDINVVYQHPDFPNIPAVPGKSAPFLDNLQKTYANKFTKEFQIGVEKILTTKGFKVLGPFASFEEMTFLEKEKCDFVIVPEAAVAIKPFEIDKAGVNVLPEYDGGPGRKFDRFGSAKGKVELSAELNMVIVEPLTKEKLLRNKVTSDVQSDDFLALFLRQDEKDKSGRIIKTSWVSLGKLPYYNYDNQGNAFGSSLANLYADFMPRIEKIISKEQFDALAKAKETLRNKKVF